MLFFLNLDGTVTRSDTDHVYQGQNKVANVELFTLISPAQAAIQVAFTLPNGLTTTYAPMSYVGAYSVDESNQKQVHRWKLAVPYNVTEVEGQVGVSFNVLLNDGTSGQTLETINQTTYTSSFLVEYSALPIPPTTATEDELGQILTLLNLYYTQNASLAAKQPFVVGTVKTDTLGANQQASVAVEQSAVADGNGNYPTNFDFGIPQGTTFTPSVDDNGNISWSNDGGKANPVTKNIKGAQGQTGATPDIEMQATVDANVGTPSVAVEKSGTAENPRFTIAFSNIKGDKGETGPQGPQGPQGATGATGATPNITMTADVVGTTGEPYVDVFKGDTPPEQPTYAFVFHNLKGEPGEPGPTGENGKNGSNGKNGNATYLCSAQITQNTAGISKNAITTFPGRPIIENDIIISTAITTFGAMSQVIGQDENTVTVKFIGTLKSDGSGVSDYNELDNIPIINQDLTVSGFTPVANTYYRHTGATTNTFTQVIIYLYDTEYHKLGESGGGTTLNKYTYTGKRNDVIMNIIKKAKRLVSFGTIGYPSMSITPSLFGSIENQFVLSGNWTDPNNAGVLYVGATLAQTSSNHTMDASDWRIKKINNDGTIENYTWNGVNYIIVYYNDTEITNKG